MLSGVISLVGPALPIWLIVAVDLTTVALVSYAAHARLAATRPDTAHLTGFYLVISVGGALGGLVNGVIAPMLFNRVWEYGLSLAAVPLLMVGLLATAIDVAQPALPPRLPRRRGRGPDPRRHAGGRRPG